MKKEITTTVKALGCSKCVLLDAKEITRPLGLKLGDKVKVTIEKIEE